MLFSVLLKQSDRMTVEKYSIALLRLNLDAFADQSVVERLAIG